MEKVIFEIGDIEILYQIGQKKLPVRLPIMKTNDVTGAYQELIHYLYSLRFLTGLSIRGTLIREDSDSTVKIKKRSGCNQAFPQNPLTISPLSNIDTQERKPLGVPIVEKLLPPGQH